MEHDGWKGVCVDFSSVVVTQNQERYPELEHYCLDMREPLPMRDMSFELIVMKGSLDAILTGGSVRHAVRECVRLLSVGGVLCVVTNGNPDSRWVHLECEGSLDPYWDGTVVQPIPRLDGRVDYMYLCRKRAGAGSFESEVENTMNPQKAPSTRK